MSYYSTDYIDCQDDLDMLNVWGSWRGRKLRSLDISDIVDQYDHTRAEQLRACGTYLKFGVNATGQARLRGANFCRIRICPMCTWRRSIKIGQQMDAMFAELYKRGYTLCAHLVLAVRNCDGADLTAEIAHIFSGYRWLTNKCTAYRQAVIGYYRALEITYNAQAGTYHPHLHCVLVLHPDYFVDRYIDQGRLVDLWRHALDVDYDPTAHIAMIEGDDNITHAVREVSKYTIKDVDVLSVSDPDVRVEVLHTLDRALRGVRLISFGGVCRTIRRELKLSDVDALDIDDGTEVADEQIRDYVYVWRAGGYYRYDA